MNCACELLATRLEALSEREEKEKLRAIEAKKEKERIIQRSIDFCETEINDALNATAKNPYLNHVCVVFKFDCIEDAYGNIVLRPLEKQKVKYRDGTASFIPSHYKHYSKRVIEDYLHQHCLNVQWANGEYSSYGRGHNNPCVILRVEVKI